MAVYFLYVESLSGGQLASEDGSSGWRLLLIREIMLGLFIGVSFRIEQKPIHILIRLPKIILKFC